MNRKITLLLTLLFLGYFTNVNAQTCPPNIDFELGTTADWLYYTGSCCPISVPTLSGPIVGRHTLTSGTGTDPYGFFPVVSPGGGSYSMKLGNDINGSQAERARYNVHVPATPGIYSLIYRYAVVLNDPGHPVANQPRMTVNAMDSVTGVGIPCASYTYIASGSIPGFLLSSLTGYGSAVWYKVWTLGNMKFPGENGKTVTVDFTTADCGYGGHFGYGYLDMTCGFFANSIIGCASGSTVLSGPDGYSAYAWYDSLTFTTSYGTSQVVTVTAPTVTTTYAVILTPYAGYGCPDTLYTRVIPSTITMTTSHDTTICSGSSITISAGASSTATPITYVWAPATGLSCTTCASPIATPTLTTTYTVTATDSAGCIKTGHITITVVPMPCAITGPATVCPLTTITEADCAPGGTWTAGPTTVGSIAPLTGVLTGISSGTVTVIYSTGGGLCSISRVVTVNPAPAAIAPAAPHVCVGSTTTLTDATSGGTWSTSGPHTSIVPGTGVVTGLTVGTTDVITYTAPGGCIATRGITVDANPAAITGITTICLGGTSTLFSSPGGGLWSCSPTTTVTVNPITGDVFGVALGTGTVTYTLPTTCKATATVTVVPLPSPIVGPTHVCIGATGIVYSDATPGGTWSVSNPSIAFVSPIGGLSIFASGVDTIYYQDGITSCSASLVLTIDPTPTVTGIPAVCVGGTTILSATGSVTWTSSDTTKATVGSTSGVVTGISTGLVNITCTTPTGCYAVTPVLVNPQPLPISGPTSLCVGTTITLSDATPGSFSTSPGTWATVTPTGVVFGSAVGTELITYTATTTGCSRTMWVTVNTTPGIITGVLSICAGTCTDVFNGVPGGAWSCTPLTLGTISPAGHFCSIAGAGTDTVSYSLGAGCTAKAVVTINALPPAINPLSASECVGASTLVLTDGVGPGSWSASCPALSVNPATGVVTGLSAGTCTVTYTLTSTGCQTTRVVTINPNPAPIGPPSPNVCINATLSMTDVTGGGTWSSTLPTIGSIVPATGVVTGRLAGTTTIKYTLPTGCSASTLLTVNPLPVLYTVMGGGSFCASGTGVTVSLSGSAVGVNYSLYNGGTLISTVTGTGGPLPFGLQTLGGTYKVVAKSVATGCQDTMSGSALVTVNPDPLPIVGPTALCALSTITLTDGTPGGGWTSSNPAAATCTAGPGSTTTVTAGPIPGLTTVITYRLPTGCLTTTTLTVSPSPSAITGPTSVCVGACVPLFDTITGGTWTSSSTAIATVGAFTGMVCGVSAGAVTITYSLGTGCTRTFGMTVLPPPLPITGPSSMCNGTCDTFHDATVGGSWMMDPGSLSLATVGSSTGYLCGISAGVATLSYVVGGTGCGVQKLVTINPMPTAITGISQVCVGSCSTTPLTSSPAGGTWSITPGTFATIGATTGVLCGVVAGGPSTVKYTAAGCSTSMPVTVNPLPTAITGTARVCQFLTTTLNSTPATGTWTSRNTAIATVTPGPSGTTVVTGGTSIGVDTIVYTLPTGCLKTIPVTVNLSPLPILGNTSVCVGHTTALVDYTVAGTWSSSNTAVASVSPTSGLVTGVSVGCVTITYTVGSCYSLLSFCVTGPPSPIVGPASVCVGDNPTYTDPTPGGTWTSSIPSIATINPTTGSLVANTSGTTILYYGSGTGCSTWTTVVVNPISPILGNLTVCQHQTTHLTDTTLGGTWTSSNLLVATVDPSGVVTGVGPGTATIQYRLPTTCSTTVVVTVNAAPSAIVGTPSVCVGGFTPLSSTPAGGLWTSSIPTIATVDPASGLVSGLTPGYTTITYALTPGTGCSVSTLVTVNANPLPIGGPSTVCLGGTVTLTDGTPGGIWMSSAPSIATIGSSSGILTADTTTTGSTTISYSAPGTGCFVTKVVNVINLPAAPTASPLSICVGQTTTFTDVSGPGGIFMSSNTTVAPINPSTGDVTGGPAPGTAVITYSLGSGCVSPGTVLTVNPLPAGITVPMYNICAGSTEILTCAPAGGTWSSSLSGVGSVDPSGLFTAISPGTTIITYQLPTGCYVTAAITVLPASTPITGINTVCLYSTTNLYNSTPGGTWSSSAPGIASVDAFGVVTGNAVGTAIISYNLGTICIPTITVTVNPRPGAIIGSLNVCQGSSTTLGDVVPGGTWSTLSGGIISITPGGVVTGIVTGASIPVPATVVYTLGAGCDTTAIVMVNPLPTPISGPNNVCTNQSITLFDATLGGTWSSSIPAFGTVDGAGDVTGIAAGVTTISYTNSYGCAATWPVTVNTSPTPITGNFNVCLYGTSTMHDLVPGGVWWSSNPSVATVGSSSGIVYGVALGSATIVYTVTGGCFVTQLINVYPLPIQFNVLGGGSHCSSDTGVHITLSGSTVGVDYLVYLGSTAVGTIHGTGSALDLGLYTVSGTYTVTGTSTATGCTINMLGSASVTTIASVTPSVSLNVTPNDTVCSGTSVTFTPVPVHGGTAPPPSYIWSVNSFPVALTPTYTFIPANGDTVTVRMTSTERCATPVSVTGTVVMKVNPFATPSVSLSVTPADTVCKGTMVTVHAEPLYGGPTPLYTWVKNGAPQTPTTGTFSYVPNDGDMIYVSMLSSYPCRLNNYDTSSLLRITVDTPVLPIVSINATPGTIIGIGQPDTLTASATHAVNPTYQWYVNGIPVPGATTNVFVSSSFSHPKEDSVSCMVTSNGICTITAHQWVYIDVTSVGVRQITAGISDINVLPNPNKGEFTVKGSLGTTTDEDVTLEITDVLGQIIYKNTVIAKNGKLNELIKLRGNVANGMYVLSLHTATDNKVFHVVIEQ